MQKTINCQTPEQAQLVKQVLDIDNGDYAEIKQHGSMLTIIATKGSLATQQNTMDDILVCLKAALQITNLTEQAKEVPQVQTLAGTT